MNASPYPGLRPFRRDETDIFFGREEQTDQILNKLGQSRFLAVVGQSGCGKSSLLRAGVIAALETGFLALAGVRWRIAEMRPGNRPLRRLAEALVGESALGPERAAEPDAIPFLHATLRRGPLGLVEAIRETSIEEQANLLLLVDQFEEIFRYRQQGDRDEADAFVALLLETVKRCESPVYVVIAMRSDFLGDCALFNGLPEAMNESQFLTPRLTREQRRAAIVGPAKVFGGEVESALVNRLLNDMGADLNQLPLMQHVLMRMWTLASEAPQPHKMEPDDAVPGERGGEKGLGSILTLADYQAVGGIANALSTHADEALSDLDVQQQRIAEVLFRCLSELGPERRATRRPVRLDEVASVAGVAPEQIIAVVEMFRRSDRSFITPPVGTSLSPDSILDISHESLIRQWQRMNQWVESEAASAEIYHRLEHTAVLWQAGGAALWSTPDLENALAWKESGKPTSAWAKRYGGHFDLAMEFLEASERGREAELQREEEARQRELKQAQALAEMEHQRANDQVRARKRLGFLVVGLAIVSVIAVVMAVVAWQQNAQAQISQKQAEDNLKRAKENEQKAFQATKEAEARRKESEEERRRAQETAREYFGSQFDFASQLSRIEDYGTAYKILAATQKLDYAIPNEPRHIRNLLTWFTGLMSGTAAKTYKGEGRALKRLALSPDGRWIAIAEGKGWVTLVDAEGGEQLGRWQGHTQEVNALVFHPKGRWLATGGDDGRIIFWSIPKAEKLQESPATDQQKDGVYALAINPEGDILASGGSDKNITLRNAETGKVLKSLKGHGSSIYGLTFSHDGQLLASASADFTARIWSPQTGNMRSILRGHRGRVYGVVFSPDGQLLATNAIDNKIGLFEVKSCVLMKSSTPARPCEPINMLSGHQNKVARVVFVDNGQRLVSASFDSTLRVWDTDSGVMLRVLQGHTGAVTDVSANDKHLFSVSEDGTLQRWDRHLEASSKDMQLVNLPGEPRSAVMGPNGSSVAVGFADGALRLYTLPEVRLSWEQGRAHEKPIKRLAFSHDDNHIASASDDNTVKIWQVSDGQLQQTFRGHRDSVSAVAFSPDGTYVASASLDGRIGLFELRTGEGRFHPAHADKVLSVAFDSEGRRLLSSGGDGETKLWRLDPWPPTLLRPFPKSQAEVMWAAFSPDGNYIARVGADRVLRIVPSEDGHPEQELLGHEGTIYRVGFSDTGQIATVSNDKTMRIWNRAKSKDVFTLRLPEKSSLDGPWDFDFRCTPQKGGEGCWIAVPLMCGKLMLYHLDRF